MTLEDAVDDEYFDDDYDDEESEWDEALAECGLLPLHLGGGCTMAGTEHCDFECPFRDHPELLYGGEETL